MKSDLSGRQSWLKMSGAGADGDEKFGIFYPARGFVF
jgi:hypothetical protein